MPRNGNGREGGNGGRGAVPRWVRTLFDQHEARMVELKRAHEEHVLRMAEMERKREEDKAEHEERMGRMDRQIALQEKRLTKLEEDRRTLVTEVSRIEGEGKEERKRDRALTAGMLKALQEIRDSLRGMNVHMSRLEGK